MLRRGMERRQMSRDRIAQDIDVVSTFQDTDDSPRCVGLRDLDDDLGQGREVFGLESEGADRIERVAVEARAEDDELRANAIGERREVVAELREVLRARCAKLD